MGAYLILQVYLLRFLTLSSLRISHGSSYSKSIFRYKYSRRFLDFSRWLVGLRFCITASEFYYSRLEGYQLNFLKNVVIIAITVV